MARKFHRASTGASRRRYNQRMPKIYLIRHGRAAASFTDDLDPGLDELGQRQAIEATAALLPLTPLAIRSSPLKRARETAAPLAERLGQEVAIEARVSEIPSPGLSLDQRGAWLREIMQGRWHDQDPALVDWYKALVDCLKSVTEDTAIFSHFVAINAAVGAAEGNDAVTLFRPDNGSITVLETDGSTLKLLERGAEAETRVN